MVDSTHQTQQSSLSAWKEIKRWIAGARLGYRKRDKIVLFIHIASAIITVILIMIFTGKDKGGQFILKNRTLLNWLPVGSVLIRVNPYGGDGALLSIPLGVDYTILTSASWENTEIKFVSKLHLSEGTLIDAGANIGIYSVVLAKRYPELRVIAIEPSAKIFNKLEENCSLNNLANMTLLRAALSDKSHSMVEFYENDSMSTMLKDFLLDQDSVENSSVDSRIPTITLDSLIEDRSLGEISLLKLDVEGAEVLALEGAKNALGRKQVKNLIVEYHSFKNYSYLVDLMKKYGYVYSIHERHQLFGNKGFLNGHLMASLPT